MTDKAPIQLKFHLKAHKSGPLCGAKVADESRIVTRLDLVNCQRCLEKIEAATQLEILRDEHFDTINRQQFERAACAVFGYVYNFRQHNTFWPTVEKVGKALGLSFARVEDISLSQDGLVIVQPSNYSGLKLKEKEVAIERMLPH